MSKLNKDGLEGGKLVAPSDHAKVLRAKHQAKREAEQKKAK